MKWFTKRNSGGPKRRAKLDVGVHAYKSAKGEERVCFYFRFGVHKKIAPSGEVIIGIDRNRVYFKDAGDEKGWMFSGDKEDYAQLNNGNPLIFKWAMMNGTEFILEEDDEGFYIEGVNSIDETESDDRS